MITLFAKNEKEVDEFHAAALSQRRQRRGTSGHQALLRAHFLCGLCARSRRQQAGLCVSPPPAGLRSTRLKKPCSGTALSAGLAAGPATGHSQSDRGDVRTGCPSWPPAPEGRMASVTLAENLRNAARARGRDSGRRFVPVLGGSASEKTAVAKAIGRACEEIGFFYIRNHGVDRAFTRQRDRRDEALLRAAARREGEDPVKQSRVHRGYHGSGEENLDRRSSARAAISRKPSISGWIAGRRSGRHSRAAVMAPTSGRRSAGLEEGL